MYGGVVLVYVGLCPLSWACISWEGGIQCGPDGISIQPMCRVSGGISEGSSVVGGVVLTMGLVETGGVLWCGDVPTPFLPVRWYLEDQF